MARVAPNPSSPVHSSQPVEGSGTTCQLSIDPKNLVWRPVPGIVSRSAKPALVQSARSRGKRKSVLVTNSRVSSPKSIRMPSSPPKPSWGALPRLPRKIPHQVCREAHVFVEYHDRSHSREVEDVVADREIEAVHLDVVEAFVRKVGIVRAVRQRRVEIHHQGSRERGQELDRSVQADVRVHEADEAGVGEGRGGGPPPGR
jgi:hypothetical protein